MLDSFVVAHEFSHYFLLCTQPCFLSWISVLPFSSSLVILGQALCWHSSLFFVILRLLGSDHLLSHELAQSHLLDNWLWLKVLCNNCLILIIVLHYEAMSKHRQAFPVLFRQFDHPACLIGPLLLCPWRSVNSLMTASTILRISYFFCKVKHIIIKEGRCLLIIIIDEIVCASLTLQHSTPMLTTQSTASVPQHLAAWLFLERNSGVQWWIAAVSWTNLRV